MTTMHLRAAARRVAIGLLAMTCATTVALGAAPARAATGGPPAPVGVTAAVAPTPTPARVGRPTTMAALGDSITQATGTGQLAQENPKNSWATGWEVNSVRARLGIATGNARNLSANGARMEHADDQVLTGRAGLRVDATTQYVTIEMGGNDLCRDSVAQMTPTATYRSQLRAALAAIRTRSPQALVYVMSVPDIFNLWYIRGAPQNGTYHPEGQSDQASGLNGARFYWDGLTGLGVKFPCQSLLANPDSYAQVDRDRRAAVRQRTLEYNAALRAECATWLRCRYDGDRLFDLTSNRATPPNGPLLPQSQWAFTDGDISRNEGAGRYLCPVQGVVAGGCGDHFHPSKAGQLKLADSASLSSYQWSDVTAPTVGLTASPAARPDGTYRGPVTVSFTGTDAAGLRGQEVRVHRPDGSVTAWDPSIGVHAPVAVSQLGTTYVEARSLDVNGNQSASRVLAVAVVPSAPTAPATPTVSAPSGTGVQVTWAPPTDTGGAAVTGYDVQRSSDGVVTDLALGVVTTTASTAPSGTWSTFRVRARNVSGPGSWSAWSGGVIAPFATPAAFVARGYADLALRAPSSNEATAALAALTATTTTPSALLADLAAAPTWDGVVAPVTRLYRSYFGRYPEAGGLAYWEARSRGGLSVNAMSQLFTGTAEFRRMYGPLSNRAFVRQVYLNVLGREPDAAGWDYWTAELDAGRYNRGRMMTFYSESSENRTATGSVVAPIVVWWGVLDRLPTGSEHVDATSLLEGGGTTTALIARILATPEWVDHVS